MSDTHILLSNDDGIDAFGLKVLEEALQGLPGIRTTTVAPASQQSATSRCMTLMDPLRLKRHGERRWSVSGTPTDSVMVALGNVLADDRPDFVISGIGVLIFTGLTAYDTQKLKVMGESAPMDDTVAIRRGTIFGALTLYLDFINLFLFLLRFFGSSRD